MDPPSTKKYKVLCLHGIGTNSDIFETQTAVLRHRLGDDIEYDFIEGAHPWPASPGIAETFGSQQVFYSYLDGTAPGAIEAVDALAQYAEEAGPFDAVIGFSLGAALAATLLLREQQQRTINANKTQRAFKCAIFLSGTLPGSWEELEKGSLVYLKAKDVDSPMQMQIPTLHAWDPEDPDHPGQSEELLQMCAEINRVQVRHGAGHGVPSREEEVEALARAIRDLLAGLDG